MVYKIDDYDCYKTLGKGAFGKVKLALGPDQRFVALKVFEKSATAKSEAAIKTLLSEIEVY